MSRPRKAAATRRTHPITFWLTPDEFARLEATALQAGLRVNELARRVTCHGRQRVVIQTTRRHDPAFIAQLRRLGNLLNQLTMRSHLTGRVSPKVEVLCDEIRELVLRAAEDHA